MKEKSAMRLRETKTSFYDDIRALIASARERVAVAVNAELTMLYWRIGDRINKEILEAKFRQAIEMARNRLAMVKERGQ